MIDLTEETSDLSDESVCCESDIEVCVCVQEGVLTWQMPSYIPL